MVWAGRPLLAYLLYVPAAVVGTLLPHILVGPLQPQQLLWGFALFTGALAEVLSWAGLGMAYTLAAWAACALGLAAMHVAVRIPLIRACILPDVMAASAASHCAACVHVAFWSPCDS